MSKNGAKEKRQEIGGGLPKAFLSHLLRLQACRSQLDLLRSLQDISTRLVVVPKLARLSSLRAEVRSSIRSVVSLSLHRPLVVKPLT